MARSPGIRRLVVVRLTLSALLLLPVGCGGGGGSDQTLGPLVGTLTVCAFNGAYPNDVIDRVELWRTGGADPHVVYQTVINETLFPCALIDSLGAGRWSIRTHWSGADGHTYEDGIDDFEVVGGRDNVFASYDGDGVRGRATLFVCADSNGYVGEALGQVYVETTDGDQVAAWAVHGVPNDAAIPDGAWFISDLAPGTYDVHFHWGVFTTEGWFKTYVDSFSGVYLGAVGDNILVTRNRGHSQAMQGLYFCAHDSGLSGVSLTEVSLPADCNSPSTLAFIAYGPYFSDPPLQDGQCGWAHDTTGIPAQPWCLHARFSNGFEELVPGVVYAGQTIRRIRFYASVP